MSPLVEQPRKGRPRRWLWAMICIVLVMLSSSTRRTSSAAASGGPDGGPVLEEPVPGSPIPSAFRPGGWIGTPPDIVGAPTLSDGELIVTDYPFDDRGADSALSPDIADHSSRFDDVLPDVATPIDGRSAAAGAMGDTTYPDDLVVGAADIVETRIAADFGAWYLLIQLNALDDPARTGFEIRVDEDRFINVRGLTADVDGQPIDVHADVARNTFELRIPMTIFDPGSGTHGILVASGVWDPVIQDWYKPPTSLSFTPFYDVAYVPDENMSSYWNERLQSQHISVQAFSRDVIPVDFDLLRAGACDAPVCADIQPYGGLAVHVLRSGQPLGEGVVDDTREAASPVGNARRYLSSFQPYAVYAPTDFAKPHPLVLLLHPSGGNYMSYLLADWLGIKTWIDEMDAVLAMPFARGEAGAYDREAEKDVFEVWRDVARRYPIDRERVYVMGVGEGGYGALRMAHLYPDQFTGVIAWAAPWESADEAICKSIDSLAIGTSWPCPYTLADLVGNTRNIPTLLVYGALDQRTPVSMVPRWASLVEKSSVPYRLVLYPAQGGHIGYPSMDASLVREWIGGLAPRAQRPTVVTYRVVREFLQPGALTSGAYWIRDVDLAPNAAAGAVTASLIDPIPVGAAYGPDVAGSLLNTSLVQGRGDVDVQPGSNYLRFDSSGLTGIEIALDQIGWNVTEPGLIKGTTDTAVAVLLSGLAEDDVVAIGTPSEFTPQGLLLHLPTGEFTITLNPV